MFFKKKEPIKYYQLLSNDKENFNTSLLPQAKANFNDSQRTEGEQRAYSNYYRNLSKLILTGLFVKKSENGNGQNEMEEIETEEEKTIREDEEQQQRKIEEQSIKRNIINDWFEALHKLNSLNVSLEGKSEPQIFLNYIKNLLKDGYRRKWGTVRDSKHIKQINNVIKAIDDVSLHLDSADFAEYWDELTYQLFLCEIKNFNNDKSRFCRSIVSVASAFYKYNQANQANSIRPSFLTDDRPSLVDTSRTSELSENPEIGAIKTINKQKNNIFDTSHINNPLPKKIDNWIDMLSSEYQKKNSSKNRFCSFSFWKKEGNNSSQNLAQRIYKKLDSYVNSGISNPNADQIKYATWFLEEMRKLRTNTEQLSLTELKKLFYQCQIINPDYEKSRFYRLMLSIAHNIKEFEINSKVDEEPLVNRDEMRNKGGI